VVVVVVVVVAAAAAAAAPEAVAVVVVIVVVESQGIHPSGEEEGRCLPTDSVSTSTMTRLVFSVGPKEVRSFRMIERHYFKDQVS